MNTFKSLLIVFGTLVMLSLATQAQPWKGFNDAISGTTRNSNMPIPGAFQIFGTYSSRQTSDWTTSRRNQYRWNFDFGAGVKCYIYCGPLSYLTQDTANSNAVVCKRDPYYYTQSTYKTFCAPHYVSHNNGCDFIFESKTDATCDQNAYQSPYNVYQGSSLKYQCCYDIANSGTLQLLDYGATTNLDKIRTAQG